MQEGTDQTDRSYDTDLGARSRRLVLRSILPGETATVVLGQGRCVVGRDASCDLVVENSRVSRRHTEIQRQGPVYALRDLESTNGTYLDGRRVQHACLQAGSLLRIGDWLGIVAEEPAGAPSPSVRELEPGLVGGSALARLLGDIELAARANLPIVLVGETGTGKELFARAAHGYTGRKGPFHALNCAALPVSLAEAELFGHAAGAFTGAERARRGHLTAAHAGTLFLDEALDLPAAIQAKLLRALELQEVVPLGETQAVRFDVQVVLACQRPLAAAVESGSFRADLAARLSGAVVHLPSLSERRGDLPSLFRAFLQRHARERVPAVSTKFYECLCLQPWPGNVRELEMFARGIASRLQGEPLLRRRHLPESMRPLVALEHAADPAGHATRRGYDAERLRRAISDASGNVAAAARKIGISRQRAYRLLRNDGE